MSDVIVLGAGIVGVSVAIHLQRRGRNVVLVDRREPGRVTAGFPVYHAEPVVEPVVPVTRPVSPASPVAAAPLHPVADEAGLTDSERAARAEAAAARDEARDGAANAPRPPFHG